MTSSAWDHRERGGSTARKTTFATERSGEGNRRVLTAGAPWGDRSRVSDRPIKPALRRRAGGRVHGCLSSERGPSGVEVKRIGISDHWLCQLSGQLENFPRFWWYSRLYCKKTTELQLLRRGFHHTNVIMTNPTRATQLETCCFTP
eukprot:2363613-Rhodomonas_salina.1